MIFSEDSRVKIPCILHLVRLGYRYLSLKSVTWDEETSLFPEIFHEAIARINPGMESDAIERFLADIKLSLENEDLGKAFYKKLTARSGSRLTDFSNNSFHVVTELTHKKGGGNWAGSVGILHGESMAEEMKLFLKGGYRLEETIRCGTENGAKFFGMERLGRLTVGRKATFLIARGTVQLLPRKLSYLGHLC